VVVVGIAGGTEGRGLKSDVGWLVFAPPGLGEVSAGQLLGGGKGVAAEQLVRAAVFLHYDDHVFKWSVVGLGYARHRVSSKTEIPAQNFILVSLRETQIGVAGLIVADEDARKKPGLHETGTWYHGSVRCQQEI
jgi:hypothetical protein